jgi:hypothetical protein
VCNGSGGCLYSNKTNGTGCNDGTACTYNDVCTNGTCGGTAYSCPLPSGAGHFECTDISCNGSGPAPGGCTTTFVNQGGSCGDCCTGGPGTCTNGFCSGGGCCNTAFCCSQ